jgi:hypothetical protein
MLPLLLCKNKQRNKLAEVTSPFLPLLVSEWKHYHKQAVMSAFRSLDLEYSISSFFRDLTSIREKTFQESTILSSFEDSGIWPVCADKALRKMRIYSKKHPSQPSTSDLPPLLTTPIRIQNAYTEIDELELKLTDFSSPSKRRFTATIKSVRTTLYKAELQRSHAEQIRDRFVEQTQLKPKPRKGFHIGGSSTDIDLLRERQRVKEQKEREALKRKVAKQIKSATLYALKAHHRAGANARRAERERKKEIVRLRSEKLPIPLDLLTSIRDPEKNPTPNEPSES